MRKIGKFMFAAAFAAGLIAVNAGAANATGGSATLSYGGCNETIYLTGTSDDYAAATFTNTGSNVCHFWLERSEYINNGSFGAWTDFAPVGSFQPGSVWDTLNPGASPWVTGQYWDGPDYRMRACFDINSGITDHCTTPGI